MTTSPSPHERPSPPASPPDADAPRANPTWRAWAAAAAVTVVVVGVGISVMNRTDGGAADVTTGEDDGGTGQDADQGGFRPGGFGGGATGEVTAIDDMTFTVETTDPSGTSRTVTVQATSDTTVSEAVEGNLGDLSTGDNVVVMGEETDGGVEASSVSETGGGLGAGGFGGEPPEGFEPPEDGELPEGFEPPDGAGGGPPQGGVPGGGITAGEIVEIDGSTIEVESADGETTTVTVTESTSVTVSEVRTLDDIEVGDTIRAASDSEAGRDDGVVTATSIQLGDLGLGGFGGGGPRGAPGTAPGTDDGSG
jgi:hypothetical protein